MKILIFLLLIIPLSIAGQNKLKYTYDAAGNRIKKEILLTSTRSEEVSTTVFTEEFSKNVVKIYPNPTQGQLAVEISDAEKAKSANLTIFNLQGKIVTKAIVISNITNLDISSEPSGVYILQINIDGTLSSWRIIKNN